MNAWPAVKVSEACELIVDCVNRTAPLASEPTPYKMIRTTNVRDGFIDTDNVRYVNEATFRRWTRRAVPLPGDVVLTREAPLGEVGIIRNPERLFLGQRTIMYRADPQKLDPYFLMYSMLGDFVQGQIRGYGSGSTVEHMRLPDCLNLLLPLPPLPTQHKIAVILSAYDDLIENDNRRIRLLEEMAQRVYGEWFVDLRYPGHETVPLVDSELGLIPENWSVRRMDEVADIVDCLHSKKPESMGDAGTGLLLQLFNVGSGGILDLSQVYRISSPDYRQWITRIELRSGDCVVTNVGRIAAVAQIPPDLKAAPGRNMTAIRPRLLPPSYLLQYLLSEHMEHEVQKKKDAGSIMDSLNVKGIVKLNVPMPSDDLLSRFELLARPIRREMEVLTAQRQNLRLTRDLLLPRLISGEVDVADLDIATPEAAA